MDSKKLCSMEGCERPACARGWCKMHWSKWRRSGSPFGNGWRGDPEKVFRKRAMLMPGDDCLRWTGAMGAHGYGRLNMADGRSGYAHRFAWERVNGPIPPGMHVDHMCRQRDCVNVAHLRLATSGENLQNQDPRGRGASGYRGVYLDRGSGRYFTCMTYEGRQYRAGRFDTPEEAATAIARLRAELMPFTIESPEVLNGGV